MRMIAKGRGDFASACARLHHLETYHIASNYYVASGSKQVKVVLALHTSDQLRGMPGRSAWQYARRTRHTVVDDVRCVIRCQQSAPQHNVSHDCDWLLGSPYAHAVPRLR